jgi:hypothetical protein
VQVAELLDRLLDAAQVDGLVVGPDAHVVDRAPHPEVVDELVPLVVLLDLEEDLGLVLGDDQLTKVRKSRYFWAAPR